jgi:hypothetical protein
MQVVLALSGLSPSRLPQDLRSLVLCTLQNGPADRLPTLAGDPLFFA